MPQDCGHHYRVCGYVNQVGGCVNRGCGRINWACGRINWACGRNYQVCGLSSLGSRLSSSCLWLQFLCLWSQCLCLWAQLPQLVEEILFIIIFEFSMKIGFEWYAETYTSIVIIKKRCGKKSISTHTYSYKRNSALQKHDYNLDEFFRN